MKRWSQVTRVLVVVWMAVAGGRASFSYASDSGDGREALRREVEAVLDKELPLLAGRQHKDGSYGSNDQYQVLAGTCVAGLAFLARGSTQTDGPYTAQIQTCLRWVNKWVDKCSLRQAQYFSLGYVMLFYGELHRLSPDEDVRADLEGRMDKIMGFMVKGQRQDGGWFYQGVFPTQKAITAIQGPAMLGIQVMRACGLSLTSALDRMIVKSNRYIRKHALPSGGYRYGEKDVFPAQKYPDDMACLVQEHFGSNISRSGACLYALLASGEAEKVEVEASLRYVWRNFSDIHTEHTYHYPFGVHFVMLAMHQLGREYADAWYPVMARDLLRRRRANGDWFDFQGLGEFQTGLALLLLQLPAGTLPISGAVSDGAARAKLDALDAIRRRAAEAERIETLLADVRHENREYRARALTELGHLDAEAGIQPMIDGCRSGDQVVAYFAARALAKFGGRAASAIPALIDLLKDFRLNTHTLGFAESVVADGALSALSAISGQDFGFQEIEEHLAASQAARTDAAGMMNVPAIWEKRKGAIQRCVEWYRSRAGDYRLTEVDWAQLSANVAKAQLAPYPGVKPPKFGVSLGSPGKDGVPVTAIYPNSVASRSGIQVQDIILEWDGTEVTDIQQLIGLVNRKETNARPVPLAVRRNQHVVELIADFTPAPEPSEK